MCLKVKAYYFLIGFFCFIIPYISAQDQRVADSLVIVYQDGKLEGFEKLEMLNSLAFNEVRDYELSLKYAEELIALSEIENNYNYIYNGYLRKGGVYRVLGDFELALVAFFKSAEIASSKTKLASNEGVAYMYVADVYSIMGNSINAENYYIKAIQLLRKTDDLIALASALLNAGDEAFNNKKYNKAFSYFEESGILFKNANYLIGTAYNLGNVGMVYAEQGQHDLAEQNINEAITILEQMEDYHPISVYLSYMADIYAKKGEMSTALSYAQRSLDLAIQYGLKDQISDANLKLSELYEKTDNTDASLKHYKDYIVYRDSVININKVEQMADLRTNHEVSQKQLEVDLGIEKSRNQRIIIFATAIALFLIGLLAIGLFRRNKYVHKTNKIIATEKERSDNLLLNILPEETAQELKENGKVKAKKFESVTVLFSDFEGFTKYSEHLSPEALVETVDYYFSKFDEIIEKYKLEKIKTIGDAYMCAGGLPFPSDDHAKRMVLAAFEIAEFVDKIQKEVEKKNLNFNVRIGINTGPVVAGVVGSKKFAYDIWGDTVNIASRMESNSSLGKINISENTYLLIKDDFECEYRGEIDAKNRGMMKMYFVNSIKNIELAKQIKDSTTIV